MNVDVRDQLIRGRPVIYGNMGRSCSHPRSYSLVQNVNPRVQGAECVLRHFTDTFEMSLGKYESVTYRNRVLIKKSNVRLIFEDYVS